MKNVLLIALAAAIAAPAIVHADPDVSSDRFKVISTGGAQQDRSWDGGFASQDYDSRDIFCADEDHYTNKDLNYDVWVTRTSGSDFSKTRLGNAGADQYRDAAFLSSFFTTGSDTDFSANIAGFGSVDALSLQSAIWRTLGYGGHSDVSVAQYAQGQDILGWLVGVTIPDAFDFSKWYVVSSKTDCSPRSSSAADNANIAHGNGASCDYQEMLANDPSRPQETVPEPATMTLLATGLIGMAAARKRRRSR